MNCGHWFRWVPAALFAVTALRAAAADDTADFFEREVRPVLAEKCWKCHGADQQSSSLRLDSREGMLRGGEGGPVIVPGEPARSRVVSAIRRQDGLEMPPKDSLSDRQIAAITRWVELGAPWPAKTVASAAKWETHWAFQPIRKPPIPQVQNAAWVQTPVDAFILARLEAEGLSPSHEADRRTLIRRASIDVTGLPPSAEEVAAFLADPDPLAYEKLIDRLLASPHYGEHWGRHWLDVARYSDTKGYVYAREERFWVHAWNYRDWVIRALNEDLPYDRFLLLQIAADLVAPDSISDQAALGFLTLGRRFLGVKHDIIDDRIDVVTRGTMGLTVGCARCHDHKYDPIPTRDYYSLYGVFQNVSERLLPLGTWDAVPAGVREEFDKRVSKLQETLTQRRQETAQRVRGRVADYLLAQLELHKYPEEGFDQILEPNDLLPHFVRRFRDYLARGAREGEPVFAAWRTFAAIPAEEFSRRAAEVAGAIHDDESLPPRVRTLFAEPPATIQDVAAQYGRLFAEIDREWRAAIEAAKAGNQPPPAALPDPQAETLRRVLYGPDAPCEPPDEPIVGSEFYFTTKECEELWRLQGEVDRWLIQNAATPPYAVVLNDRPHPVNARVLRRGNPALLGDEVPRQFLEVLSRPQRSPFQSGSGRLELAQAIVDPHNPLTARVIVNRVWQHHFGTGLVRTPSDFGLRAEPPTHPELLDWLAAELVEGRGSRVESRSNATDTSSPSDSQPSTLNSHPLPRWSLKSLHRQILLSATYRQASHASRLLARDRSAAQSDPGNRLLWRMNARRLSWEELRDALLCASGDLNDQIGGRPFDLFAANSPGRRTVYGLIDRQFLPGTLRMFDFANPDLHIPQRSETIVPQQALFLLNHRLVIDRAEALAQRTAAEPQAASDRARAAAMFQYVFQRDPANAESDAALELVRGAALEQKSTPEPVTAWSYGYGAYNEQTQRVDGFTRLPYFTGTAWQGGPNWPDDKLGWVQLTADGGHAGNDRQHAAVRRWTAPRAARVQVRSVLIHDKQPGDGIRGFLVSSRQGLLHSATLHNAQAEFQAAEVELEAGDTLDFVVDIGDGLNNDDFTWQATIAETASSTEPGQTWTSRTEFSGIPTRQLSPWGQLAQVLLLSNEFFYVD